MNERILELMEEAGIYDFVIESMGINEEIEKFAELIIRECAEVASDYDGACYVGEAVTKHFGVEE